MFSDGIGKLLSNTFEFETDPDMDGLIALVTEIRTELNHQHCAFERFTINAYGLLPLENQIYPNWFGRKKDYIMQMLNCDKQHLHFICRSFWRRLGK